MSKRMRRKTKQKASSGEWERLIEDATLRNDFTALARLLQQAQLQAERKSQQLGIPMDQAMDIRQATQLLHRNPLLTRYLLDIAERETALTTAADLPDLARAAGSSGQPVQAMQSSSNIGG